MGAAAPVTAVPVVPADIPRTVPLRTKIRGLTVRPGEPVMAVTNPADATATVAVTPGMVVLPPVATLPACAVAFTSPVTPVTDWDRTPALIPASCPRRSSGWPWMRLPGEPLTAVAAPAGRTVTGAGPAVAVPGGPGGYAALRAFTGHENPGLYGFTGRTGERLSRSGGCGDRAGGGEPGDGGPGHPGGHTVSGTFSGHENPGPDRTAGRTGKGGTVPAVTAAVTVDAGPGITWVSVPPDIPRGAPFLGTKTRGRIVRPGDPVTAWMLPAVDVTNSGDLPVITVLAVPGDLPRAEPFRTNVRGRATLGSDPDTLVAHRPG